MKMLLGFFIMLVVCIFSPSCNAGVAKDYHLAMHRVRVLDSGYCTAYATGPHSIMIATHCLTDNDQEKDSLIIDPKTKNEHLTSIVNRFNDLNDHEILNLRGIEFSEWIDIIKYRIPEQGDKVHFWGAPGALYCKDCYSEGYFSGVANPPIDMVDLAADTRVLLFVMSGAPGDSGSLIFDENNNIVGMLSISVGGGFIGSFNLHFTPSEWSAARK
jgi:hypothetical protein